MGQGGRKDSKETRGSAANGPEHESLLFDRFELVRNLGEGGFGTVYRAHDHCLGQDVALKCLHRNTSDGAARFKREFRSMIEMTHPNIVRLGEFFEQENSRAFSMELVDGTDLVTWAAGLAQSEAMDIRLGPIIAQLASGLSALHRAGFIHRDIKPQNVLVTPEGRVVLLDFGLVTALDTDATTTRFGLGTLAYMAPEQAEAGRVTPAADLYAVGALLYEVLTGRPPFLGSGTQLLLAKFSQVPLPPSMIRRWVPPALEDLTLRCLSIEPDRRPTASELVELFGHAADEPRSEPSASVGYIGRAGELSELLIHYEAAKTAGPRLVLVEGESGIGKTALIDRLLEVLRARESGSHLFHGRCHAFEHARYKAFDDIAMQLSRACRERAPPSVPLPKSVDLLPQLLPGFGLGASRARPQVRRAERHDLFQALVNLLEFLACGRPVVLAIDDLQWADRDSTLLLEHLLNFCGGHLLVIASLRSKHAEERSDADELTGPRVHKLRLSRLASEDARDLATKLLGPDTPASTLQNILRGAAGHPLHLRELVRSSQERGIPDEDTLERSIERRVERLGAQLRLLLELVSVAGAPVLHGVLARAAGVESGPLFRALAILRAEHFLCEASGHGEALPYHDRVRESVVGTLSEARLRELHLALARGYQRLDNPRADQTARHYLAAGEHAQAAPWLELAAKEAFDGAAYARAADLYGLLLSFEGVALPPDRRWHFQLARSDSLACSGAYGSSADALLSLLKTAELEPTRRREVLVRAAQRLLQAGQAEKGISIASEAMLASGLPWSTSAVGSALNIARNSLASRWYETDAAQHVEGSARRGDRRAEQLDTLWRLTVPLYSVDILRCIEISSLHLQIAEQVRDPRHLALGLSAHSVLTAMRTPNTERAKKLSERSKAWGELDDSASTRAYLSFSKGGLCTFEGRLKEAAEHYEVAERIYSSECPDELWLQTNARAAWLTTLFHAGAHKQFVALGEAWLREARGRGDAFAIGQYSVVGQAALRHIVNDEPDAAMKELDSAIEPWMGGPFGTVRLGESLVRDAIIRYAPSARGTGLCAGHRPLGVLTSSALFRNQIGELIVERKVLALLRIELQRFNGHYVPSARLGRQLRQLSRASSSRARAVAGLVNAQLYQLELRTELARAHASDAEAKFTANGQALDAQAASLVAARAVSPSQEREQEGRLRETLRREGWANIDRALAWLLPIHVLRG